MHLDKLFSWYLSIGKKLAQTLPDNIRTKACQWITKLEAFPAPEEDDKKVRLHALKLLQLSLSRKELVGPFENSPDDKEISEYNWNSYQLNDFVNMIKDKEQAASEQSKISYAVNGNRRKLVTYQSDPQTGQHCCYAYSREPVERWHNLQGGAIPSETIDTWQERGEWGVLNDGGSQTSSVDAPRCQPQSDTRDVDFVIHDERRQDSNVHPRTEYKADKSLHARPKTPVKLGGSSQAQSYEPEQFGLTREERFRSPRSVFQHSQYDQCPLLQKSSMPQHIIEQGDETIKKGTHLKKLKARLDNLRDTKHQPLQNHFSVDLEPNEVEYESIRLEDLSFNDLPDINRNEDDEESLGILSVGEMYNEDLFGEDKVPADRSMLKENDGTVVSRSVVKIETNTTICGNERHVTEEILEQEEVKVPQIALAPDQSHINHDIMLKRTEQRPIEEECGTSHNELKKKAEDISRGFEDSRRRLNERERRDHQRFHPAVDVSEQRLEDISQPQFSSTYEDSRPRSEANRRRTDQSQVYPFEVSERLEDVRQPDFPHSFEDSKYIPEVSRHRAERSRFPNVDESERLTDVRRPQNATTFEGSTHRSDMSGRRKKQSRLPDVDNSELLTEVSQPQFAPTFEDSRARFENSKYIPEVSRHRAERSRFPNVDESERLTDVRQPQFATTFEDSTRRSERSGSRKQQSRLPDVDNSELLTEVSQPQFAPTFEDSLPRFENSKYRPEVSRRRAERSRFPNVDESERLTDVRQPQFATTFEDSTRRSDMSGRRKKQSRLPDVDNSELLTEVSQPQFAPTFEDSRARFENSKYRPEVSRHRAERSRFPNEDESERLTDVRQPEFATTFEDSTRRSNMSGRRKKQSCLPNVDNSELLTEVSQPQFAPTFEDSLPRFENSKYRPEVSRRRAERSRFPNVDKSERLADVRPPQFATTFEDSTRRSEMSGSRKQQSRLPDVDNSGLLTEVREPQFAPTFEDSRARFENSKYRPEVSRRRAERSRFTNVDESERLTDVRPPQFATTFEDSTRRSKMSRSRKQQSRLPDVDNSELLTEVSEPQFAPTFEDSLPRFENSKYRPEVSRRRVERSRFPNVDESERLTDVRQPQFATTFEDSRSRSEANRRKTGQSQFYTMEVSEKLEDVPPPDFPHSLENSEYRPELSRRRAERSRLPNVDLSERLTDISQPHFASTFEGSRGKLEKTTRTNGRKRVSPDNALKRIDDFSQSLKDSRRISGATSRRLHRIHNPDVDLSEQLADVSQPNYPSSLQMSEYDKPGLVSIDQHTETHIKTYTSPSRRTHTKRITTKQTERISEPHYSEENLDDISQPIFHSVRHDSKESTHPSHRSTIQSPRNLQNVRSKAPHRHRFPKQDPTAKLHSSDRAGDYRKPFITMPHYLPFEKQIDPKWSPGPTKDFITKLRRPGTFATSTTRIPTHDRKNQTHRSPSRERLIKSELSRMAKKPDPRQQAGVSRQRTDGQIARERLTNKSSIKYQVTKSKFFKDRPKNIN